MRPITPLRSLAVVLLLAPSALAQTERLPDAPKELFVEIPGELEFTARMNVRPIQPEDAERYGLSPAEVQARRAAAVAALSAYEEIQYWPEVDEHIIAIPEGTENEVAERLMSTGDFQYVEPDWLAFPIACSNDPLLGSQWHHNSNRMNSCLGWDLEVGDPSIVVAICDTGVRTTHQDLQLNRKEGYNAVNKQWENSGGAINDINGHGTLTTGCAAANGNNGIGVSGTGWNLSHRMMRVTNSSGGGAYISDLTHAARTAADVGDKVASVSYSGVKSSGVDTAGAYMRGKGALLVWAAGNDGQNLTGSRDDNVIVVGATDSGDNKPSWSNYGSFVDLMAPGSGILATSNAGNASYGSASGTSFSCPLTAGLCGLIYSANPTLTPTQVENILRSGCDDLGSSGVDNTYGYGRIDVYETLLQVVGGPSLLYFDDFESGGFGAGGWTISSTARCKVNDISDYSGVYGARLKKGGVGTVACTVGTDETWMQSPAIDTTGYGTVEIRLAAHFRNNELSCEYLDIQWWNGASWESVKQIAKHSWTEFTVPLPAGAANNPSLVIRMITNAKGPKERAEVDNFAVFGS